MILVMLQLESELPRANCITPSQGSILEPLLGTLLGSPWCPPNHISLSFPIWGSCAWSMNRRIHVFSMKINWFQVVSGALMAWSWLLLVFHWMGWSLEKKKGTAGWSFLAFCHITFNFMSHEKWWNFSLWRKGLTPDGHMSSSSDLIRQVGTWWQWAPTIELCWN